MFPLLKKKNNLRWWFVAVLRFNNFIVNATNARSCTLDKKKTQKQAARLDFSLWHPVEVHCRPPDLI